MGIRYFSSSSRKVSPKGWPNEEEFDDEDFFNQRSNEQKEEEGKEQRPIKLTHVNQNGTAHMVAVGNKRPTHRTAFAVSTVRFSKPEPLRLIKQNAIKKGDVLSVARIAGIMAAKQTPTIIPLCHNIDITHAEVEAGLIEPPSAENSTTTTPRANEANEEDLDDDDPSPLTHHRPDSRARLYSTSHLSPGDPRAVADAAAAYPFGGVLLTARVETTGRTGVEMDALHAASAAALTVYDMCKAVDKAMSLQNARVVLKTGGKSGDWVDVGWLFARAGVVRRGGLEGLMMTAAAAAAGGAVDEGVRRRIKEVVVEGEGGGLARREWKKCYRVLTRSGWEPEKAMQLLSWIPRKAYSPAAVENGGAEGVEGEEGVAAAAAAAAEAEALEEEMVVEEDDAEALEEEEGEELVVDEEDVEDLEELAREDYATILEQQLMKELEELEREELLDDEEGKADDVEEEVLEDDDQPPVPAGANNKGVQNGSVGRQEEEQQSARMEEEKEDTEPAPPSTTTTTSAEMSPPSSAPTTAAATSAGASLKKPVETTMALFNDAQMADADSNQNSLLTASMIRQMSPRDLFADNARSSGKRRGFQTKAQKIQEEDVEEDVEEEVDREVDEESDREFEEEVRQQKEYFEQKARAYREQRKLRRRERKEAIKQEKRDLKREKEQEKKKRLTQLLALEAEEMRKNWLEEQATARNPSANVLRNSEGEENKEEAAAIRNSFYTTTPRRPTPSFHHDPDGFIAAAERRSKGDKPDGIGFALPQVQPTIHDIKRAQKSPASTQPMPEHLKHPAERLERQRWLRNSMWDKRMEKLAALDRMAAAARRSPKYSPHWNRARSQGGRAMVTLALAAKIGVHTSRYDILQWTPPGLDDDDAEALQKVGEEELRASWKEFVKTSPPKLTWKYMQLKKEGVDTKYVLRHRVVDEKERLKRAMSRVDYNEWCLLNNVMAKRQRRWDREAGFAEVEERAQEETRKVLSTPAPGEAWYDQLLEDMEDDVKDDTKDEGKTESVSDESSNAREDGSDEFDELQSLIDKKSKMTTEGKEGKKGKKGKKGKR